MQLIGDMVGQRSRHEFLTMAYEIEAKTHRDTHKILTAVSMLLRDSVQALTDRMVRYRSILIKAHTLINAPPPPPVFEKA